MSHSSFTQSTLPIAATRGSNNKSTTTTMDLDAFVTGVESKLRVPFSSLDLTKAIVTPALRGSSGSNVTSAADYLTCLAEVIARTDKVIRMRALLSLLGLEPDAETDPVIARICQETQEGPLHEDWVRAVSGLVQGLLFQQEQQSTTAGVQEDEDDEQSNSEAQFEPMRGEEAQQLLDKASNDIFEQLQAILIPDGNDNYDLLHNGSSNQNGERSQRVTMEDADPTCAPYRYALLKLAFLSRVIPTAQRQSHFTVNTDAAILHVDRNHEEAKNQEEHESGATHKGGSSNAPKSTSPTKPSATATRGAAILPGRQGAGRGGAATAGRGRMAAAAAAAAAQRPKSSLFMPSNTLKRATASASKPLQSGTMKAPVPTKAVLHVRKAGASQALVGKGRRLAAGLNGSSTGGAGAGGAIAGRAGRALGGAAAAGKSKMKMLDVTEVQDLEQDKMKQAEEAKSVPGKRGPKRKFAEVNGATAKAGTTASTTTAAAAEKPPAKNLVETPVAAPAAAQKQQDESFFQHPDEDDDNDNDEAKVAPNIPTLQQPQQQQHQQQLTQNDTWAANALVTGALSTYQAQVGVAAPAAAAPAAYHHPPQPQYPPQQLQQHHHHPHHRQTEWRELLAEKNNKLTEPDRHRVEQFFLYQINPRPEELTYRMKLHEERGIDPNTGDPVKETYYLELDYTNFTSKQSKKIKRYKDSH
jgi:hypothetical protein